MAFDFFNPVTTKCRYMKNKKYQLTDIRTTKVNNPLLCKLFN